jgi:hypothetical protein
MALFDNTIDILLGDGGELLEKDGDFLVGDASNRYIEYLLSAHPGHYKEFPAIGVGIHSYLNSSVKRNIIQSDITRSLNNDIFNKPDVDVSEWPSKIVVNSVVVEKL